jgi:hypothetical protein
MIDGMHKHGVLVSLAIQMGIKKKEQWEEISWNRTRVVVGGN